MAGKGGGAWKVAYADFVTAMMAFFLVMWIVAQGKEVKDSVSHYFVDPLGNHPIGRPAESANRGSMMETSQGGAVPNASSMAMGRGRHANSDNPRAAQATEMVENWLRTDEKQLDYWVQKAHSTRQQVVQAASASTSQDEIDAATSQKLAQQLKEEIEGKLPKDCDGIYKDMLIESMQHIKWQEVAEDIVTY